MVTFGANGPPSPEPSTDDQVAELLQSTIDRLKSINPAVRVASDLSKSAVAAASASYAALESLNDVRFDRSRRNLAVLADRVERVMESVAKSESDLQLLKNHINTL